MDVCGGEHALLAVLCDCAFFCVTLGGRYDKCVDAEIEWLRIKYEQQREKAIEQALEQGLMLRGENTEEDMNSTVLDDDATTEAGFLQGIAPQSKFHRGMDDESTFSSESDDDGGSCPQVAKFIACPPRKAKPFRLFVCFVARDQRYSTHGRF